MEIKYFTQNIKLSGELQDFLEEKIQKLSRYSDKIWQANVDISFNPGHNKNQLIRLEINLRMPNKILRAETRSPNLRQAIDDLEKKLRKQLEKYKEFGRMKRKITKKTVNKIKSL
jgi:ribosomal subunit interface protein